MVFQLISGDWRGAGSSTLSINYEILFCSFVLLCFCGSVVRLFRRPSEIFSAPESPTSARLR